jgi:hypothetical protein
MSQDLLPILRGLLRRPAIPIFAVLTLGLGVSGTIAVGSERQGERVTVRPVSQDARRSSSC